MEQMIQRAQVAQPTQPQPVLVEAEENGNSEAPIRIDSLIPRVLETYSKTKNAFLSILTEYGSLTGIPEDTLQKVSCLFTIDVVPFIQQHQLQSFSGAVLGLISVVSLTTNLVTQSGLYVNQAKLLWMLDVYKENLQLHNPTPEEDVALCSKILEEYLFSDIFREPPESVPYTKFPDFVSTKKSLFQNS